MKLSQRSLNLLLVNQKVLCAVYGTVALHQSGRCQDEGYSWIFVWVQTSLSQWWSPHPSSDKFQVWFLESAAHFSLPNLEKKTWADASAQCFTSCTNKSISPSIKESLSLSTKKSASFDVPENVSGTLLPQILSVLWQLMKWLLSQVAYAATCLNSHFRVWNPEYSGQCKGIHSYLVQNYPS